MPYIQRDPVRNAIVGAYEQKQDFAREYVDANDPEYIAFARDSAAGAASADGKIAALETRLAAIEARIAVLAGGAGG